MPPPPLPRPPAAGGAAASTGPSGTLFGTCADARRILLVDEDAAAMRSLATALARRGYAVSRSACPAALAERAAADAIDLVVLDPGLLPGLAAPAACAALAAAGVRLLLVSRLPGLMAELTLLAAGADGYLAKPAPPERVVAHAEALLRRPPACATRAPLHAAHGWHLDDTARRVQTPDGRWRTLAPLEACLLRVLLDRYCEVVSRRELLAAAVQADCAGTDEELDQYIHYLRRKIERGPSLPRYLQTVRGAGYRLGDTDGGSESTPRP